MRDRSSGKVKKHVIAWRSHGRRRLSAKAKQLRKEFHATVLNPTADEKQQLRERIGRLPGCEWYLDSKKPDLNYQSSIRRQRRDSSVVENIRREKLSWLTESLRHQPNPDLETLLSWAQHCDAEPCWLSKHIMMEYLRLHGSASSAATDGRIQMDVNPTTDEYRDPDNCHCTCQCPPLSCSCGVYGESTPGISYAGTSWTTSDSHWLPYAPRH